jgi:hypothetical protein
MRLTRTYWHRKFVAIVFACVGSLAAGAAMGQAQKMAAQPAAKTPQITSVFPAGGQRGSSVSFEIKGKNLAEVTDLHFSAPGAKVENLEAKGGDRLLATVAIDKDAALGNVELRALAADGLSNLKLVRVDELPEATEADSKNDLPEQAQPVEFPVVLNGQLSVADVDCYRIHIAKRTRLVLEVEARRLGSPADTRLRVLDARGEFLVEATASPAVRPDERIDYEFAGPADYIVVVEDAQYGGGDGAIYRLRVGQWPYAATMFPLGGRRGESVEVTIEGGNLREPLKQRVELPADPQVSTLRPEFKLKQGTLIAPMTLAVGDSPEVTEQEPNDDAKEPQSVPVPIVVNGRISQSRDKDRFVIEAKKGEKIAVEVFADRLGSALDSVLTVTDKNGRQVAENDDVRTGPTNRNQRIAVPQPPVSDSRAEFTAPADGAYTITIDDRYNGGGPEFAYRLQIGPNSPDFSLAYGAPQQPNQQQQRQNQPSAPTDVINLEPGKSVTIPVTVTRRGYDGPIELTAEELPRGLSAQATNIAAKQAGGQVVIKAEKDAERHVGRVRIIGSAKIDGQDVRRPVQQEIVLASIDPTHVARHAISDFALVVARREQPLAVKAPDETVLARGTEAELQVSIDRRAGLKGPVTIKLDKLPKGVEATTTTIADDETMATVKISAAANVAIAKPKIQVISQGKLGAATVQATAEVSLAIVMPFELALDPKEKQIEVAAGESCSLKLGVKRQGNFDGPITLAVTGLPAGVTATPDKIEAGEYEIEVSLATTAETKLGKRSIKIQAVGEIGKQKITVETAAIVLTVKPAD